MNKLPEIVYKIRELEGVVVIVVGGDGGGVGGEILHEFALGISEQSGVNVTKGYNGAYDTNIAPI